jgi:hypothetical protein
MNIEEGSTRTRTSGRVIAFVALGVLLLMICGAIINELYGPHSGSVNWVMIMLEDVMSLGAWAMVAGTALWIAGWIVKGFSQNEKPDAQSFDSDIRDSTKPS